MILPIQCFGKDSKIIPIFPEESHVRSKKFMLPQSYYSVLVKKSNFLLFANSTDPKTLQINIGNNSIKLTRQFIITDEFERYEIHSEITLPHDKYSKISLKIPYGFNYKYKTDSISINVSEKSFCFSTCDQSRENYKYYLLFSIGEKISFISQVQYSKKTLLSVFYNIDQLSLVHSVHPFTPNLLISSCLKMRNVGPFDFFQKISYQSNKYQIDFSLYNIIKDLQKVSLRKNSTGINLIKKFKYLKTGLQVECNQQNIFQTNQAFYLKFNFNKVSPIILTDFQRTKLAFKINLSQNNYFKLALTKPKNNTKIGFMIKYIFND